VPVASGPDASGRDGAPQQVAAMGSKEADVSAVGNKQNNTPDPGHDGTRAEAAVTSPGSDASAAAMNGVAPGGVLPTKAAEDDPRRWGDQPEGYDHDSWLEEQKPPHWG